MVIRNLTSISFSCQQNPWTRFEKYCKKEDAGRNFTSELELTRLGLLRQNDSHKFYQHWIRYWLVASQRQAITWTNIDSWSLRSWATHLIASSHEMLKMPAFKTCLNRTHLFRFILVWLKPRAIWDNEFIRCLRGVNYVTVVWQNQDRFTSAWLGFAVKG